MLVVYIIAIHGHPISWRADELLRKNSLLYASDITRRIIKSPDMGGQDGEEFDDRVIPPSQDFVSIARIQSISIFYGDYPESIQVTYLLSNQSLYKAPRHGNAKGSEVTINLANNEYLLKVEGYHNDIIVQQLVFTTVLYGYDNKTFHKYGPYGNAGNISFLVEGYGVGFHGRFERYRDGLISIGMYSLAFLNKSEEFGGGDDPRLSYFDDEPDKFYAPVSRMNAIKINHGDYVDAISTVYTVLNGDIYQTYKHGGDGGTLSTIYLTVDEAIIGVEGSTGGQYINQIKFITQRRHDGSVRGYGPYGKAASKQFSFYGNIMGFSGKYLDFLYSFSVYYT